MAYPQNNPHPRSAPRDYHVSNALPPQDPERIPADFGPMNRPTNPIKPRNTPKLPAQAACNPSRHDARSLTGFVPPEARTIPEAQASRPPPKTQRATFNDLKPQPRSKLGTTSRRYARTQRRGFTACPRIRSTRRAVRNPLAGGGGSSVRERF